MQKIVIRPSGVSSFFDCPYRWYRDTLYKPIRKVGLAAHLGTGVHKASEVYYKECISSKKWVNYKNDIKDVAIDEFRKIIKDDEPTDIKEYNLNDIETTIAENTQEYLNKAEKLNNYNIPKDVEKTYEIKIKSDFIDSVKGTLDIVGEDYIADIKTMSKFKNAKTYVIQQSIYAFLREKSGDNIKDLLIHRINTSKSQVDSVSILEDFNNPYITMDALIDKAKFYLKSIIKTCESFNRTGDEILFRGNPNSMLCSEKYCAYYKECKYRKEG
ncbi:TPA: PD-(D/E)XK nuclease family protein [Campylobacter jejuni]|nr:PD-(D/E)XK nuclease family protein [Campylobacter jejuni]